MKTLNFISILSLLGLLTGCAIPADYKQANALSGPGYPTDCVRPYSGQKPLNQLQFGSPN